MTRLFRRRRFWLGLALLAALVVHHWRWSASRTQPVVAPVAVVAPNTALGQMPLLSSRVIPSPAPVKAGATPRWASVVAVPDDAVPLYREDRFPDRLRNTPEKVGALARNDHALLLRNALFDTANGQPLPIPSRLMANEAAGTFIVQARDGVNSAFYARIQAEGGRVISYIPNNALLVEAAADAAQRIASAPEVATVLPNHPYLKFEPGLLARVLRDAPLPPEVRVAVSVTGPQGITDIQNLGEDIESVQRGPFGQLVYVRQPKDLIALAKLPTVPLLEEARLRVLLNDRTAVILGSVTNADNTGPVEGLTGAGLLVNLNDSGIDVSHPDIGPAERVLTTDPSFLADVDGHGTHVAATIAGNGKQSSLLSAPPQGSVTNANFKGKAPGAKLMILPIDLRTGPTISDAFLQETFARTNREVTGITNAPISNNSWGYIGAYEYTSISASYDLACRDALPDDPGEQPILYVFSAGNDGEGASNGAGGFEDSVLAPGNGKNVITVGALESGRFLTNVILYDTNNQAVWANGPIPGRGYSETNSYRTNRPFAAQTDTDYEVAYFSSRGNVGIGTEGDFGRFKPDVVAPGAFIFSARSQQWDLKSEFSFVADPSTNEYYRIYDEINQEGGKWYRYESGTSMAAPAISGLLAQIVEYFEIAKSGRSPQRIPVAGYKAILINSAQPTSETYNYNTRSTINYAGWGRPNLTRALGGGFKMGGQPVVGLGVTGPNSRGLATGQGQTYRLRIDEKEKGRPLTLTLAWTDPPGNPAAGIKLVNNLDLIVSNTLTGEFFVGNDFGADSRFSQAHSGTDTNLPAAQFDFINNVERVIVPGRETNADLVVMVLARRVNVNAPTGEPTDIVQDSALVFAGEGATLTDSVGTIEFEGGTTQTGFFSQPPLVIGVTNGEVKINERVGANSPLLGGSNGTPAQWRFFVFTNAPATNTAVGATSGPNVAFVTFLPPNLSQPRSQKEADIDLYVSRDRRLTNLEPTVVAGAFKSTQRGGTELVTFTNARVAADEVFYVGVKSEDQQASEFSFIALSSQRPFGSVNGKGELVFPGFSIKQPIPDGTPDHPGYGLSMSLATIGGELRRLYVDETITHSAYLDLVNTLNHNQQNVVLQNNRLLRARDGLLYSSGVGRSVTYDDSGSGDDLGGFPSHGPGSLISYSGRQLQGVWLQQAVDNRLGNEGRIDSFTIRALTNDFGPFFVRRTVQPGRCQVEVINVPSDASRLRVVVTNFDPALPLRVFIKREGLPNPNDPTSADKFATLEPPGGTVSIGIRDVPPLQAGRYFIAVCNPNNVAVTYRIAGFLDRELDASFSGIFNSGVDANGPIKDEAVTQSSIFVNDSRPVAALEVGLRLPHQRESDLFIHLVNPAGQRTLIAESRGLTDTNGFGSDNFTFNFTHVALTFDRLSGAAHLYVNGRPVAQDSFPGFDPATLGDFIFGRDLSGRLSPTDSPVELDDFAMWKRSLQPDEIISIYNQGFLGTPKGADAAQAARYPFDGNGLDVTGHGADALLGTTPRFEPGQFDRAVELGGTNGFALADNQPFRLVISNLVVTNIIGGIPTVVTNSSTNVVRRTPPLDVGTNGFTLEGWVTLPSGDTNIVIAGWSDRTNYYAPALLVGFDEPLGSGPGSFSAALVDTNGSARFLISRPGVISTNPFLKTFNYALFSENTNRASEVIKFAPPPFSGELKDPVVVVGSGFESALVGTNRAGSSVEDWLVTTNAVLVDSGGSAYEGSHWLVLGGGSITRLFGTAPGQKYQLNFRTRRRAGDISTRLARFLFNGELDRELSATADWTTQVTSFVAKTNFVTFGFESLVSRADTNAVAFGLEIDGIELKQLGAEVLYLPEESMLPLLGGNAFGNWHLELTDARGSAVGELLSWELRLTFAPTNPPVVRLTNGVAYHGTNLAQPSYFYFDVPLEATVAVNQLQSQGLPLRLIYNDSGLPDSQRQPGDVVLLSAVTAAQATAVTTTQPPILPRGQRYYLEVLSLQGNTTNEFDILVNVNVPITPLTNNVAFSRTNLLGGREDFYSFEVSTQAIGATFEVLNPTQDVDLYLSPAPDLPRPEQTVYASQTPGLGDERIVLSGTSQPVPLRPGRWHLGVYNNSTNPAQYSVVARETRATLTGLTNDVPIAVTNAIGERFDYYYIDVASDAISGRFELTGLTGEADLFVRWQAPLPSLTTYDYASTNDGILPERILVTVFDSPVPMQSGRWLVGVRVKPGSPVNYQLLASIQYAPADLVDLFDAVPDVGNGNPPGRTDYRFTVINPTVGIRFELSGLDGPANLFVARGTLPRAALRTFSSPRGGTTAEVVTVSTNDYPNLAVDWYLTVERPDGGATNWTVTATTLTDVPPPTDIVGSLVPPATPGDPYLLQWSVTVPNVYYQVETSTNLSLAPLGWLPYGNPILGDKPVLSVTLTNFTDPSRFYRVTIPAVQPQP